MIDKDGRAGLLAVVARAALVALLAVVLAVIPVTSAVTNPVHEVWLAGAGSGMPSLPRVRVRVHDRTGLIHAVSAINSDLASNPKMIVVKWLGGCGDWQTDLYFDRRRQGYRVLERTAAAGCPFMIGYQRSVALHLRFPADPASVEVVDREGAD